MCRHFRRHCWFGPAGHIHIDLCCGVGPFRKPTKEELKEELEILKEEKVEIEKRIEELERLLREEG